MGEETVKLDHVAIAVSSLEEVEKLYSDLGMAVTGREDIPEEGLRVAFIKVGETRIELLESTDPSSAVAKFLVSHGPGLHHIALVVSDIKRSLEELKERGYRLIDEEPREGAAGKLIAFVHPKATGGVLLELCGEPPANGGAQK